MKIVEYVVRIAAFEPGTIPESSTVEAALEECIENIETDGNHVTVQASFLGEATIDPSKIVLPKDGEKNK